MTLITKILTELEDPTNREIVNDGQDYFDVDISDNLILFFRLPIEELSEIELFFIIRYCINLLPYFEANSPLYVSPPFQDVTDDIIERYKTLRQALLCSGAMTVQELNEEHLKLIK